MYRKINDFLDDWKTEESFTVNIFNKIPDENISIQLSENVRSLGRLGWHITQTLTEMPFKSGLINKDLLENEPIPKSFNKIIDHYQRYSNQLVESLKANWKDSDLLESIEIYGQTWEKRKILSVLITHQAHHRAQMTVLMRLQNIEVPGTYGPSKEEWVKYGMDPQE